MIKLYRQLVDGQRQIISLKLPGDLIRPLFDIHLPLPCAVAALTELETVDAQSLESEIVIDDYDDDNQWKMRAAASKATTDEVLLKQRLDPPRRMNLDDYV